MSGGPSCPFCDGSDVELVSRFGSQILTSQWVCRSCGSYFEAIREEFYDVPTFDAVYGLELLDSGGEDGAVRARVPIEDKLRQQFGLVHGGVVSAIAEALASLGTWLAVHEDGKVVSGMRNETSFLRPLLDGHIHAAAAPQHRAVDRWVWEVLTHDDDERLCAISTVDIAVRDPPAQPSSAPK